MLPSLELLADLITRVIRRIVQDAMLPWNSFWNPQLAVMKRIENLPQVYIMPDKRRAVLTRLDITMAVRVLHPELAVLRLAIL